MTPWDLWAHFYSNGLHRLSLSCLKYGALIETGHVMTQWSTFPLLQWSKNFPIKYWGEPITPSRKEGKNIRYFNVCHYGCSSQMFHKRQHLSKWYQNGKYLRKMVFSRQQWHVTPIWAMCYFVPFDLVWVACSEVFQSTCAQYNNMMHATLQYKHCHNIQQEIWFHIIIQAVSEHCNVIHMRFAEHTYGMPFWLFTKAERPCGKLL